MIARPYRTRFELKYLASEQSAQSVRQFVTPFLTPDAHVGPRLNGTSYRVHSLYLDSADRCLYHQTLDGVRKRIKLRLRYYDTPSNSPVFVEVKHKIDRGVFKDRAAIRPAAIERLLRVGSVRADDLLPGSNGAAVARFVDVATSIGARGSAIVSYDREAYLSQDDKVRVTFDRRLAVSPPDAAWPLSGERRPFFIRMGGVIVEMKFNGVFPGWLSDVVQMFGLERRPIPKYVICTQALQSRDYRAMRRFEVRR